MVTKTKSGWSISYTWLFVLVCSGLWWWFAGESDWHRTALLIGLSLASFGVGSAGGFLFTSFGEEQGTLGKIRDWLIGGITGITVAEVMEKGGTFKELLKNFQSGDSAGEFGIVISMAVIYTCLGFFFMFFQRELIFNVLLATKRAERNRIEGTTQTGIIIQKIGSVLPASILTGVDDISQISQVNSEQAKRIQEVLYSSEVEAFVTQAEAALKEGIGLDFDIVSKMAYVFYYRTYFEKQNKAAMIQHAIEWLERALIMNPKHADLTMKYADMLASANRYDDAVDILERLNARPESPREVTQWLGYFLLYVPDRLNDAIKYSEIFLRDFPRSDAVFNLACAHAQLYGKELKATGKQADASSVNRRQALAYLERALDFDPSFVQVVLSKWIDKGEDFECLKTDADFLKITDAARDKARLPAIEQKPAAQA